MMEQMTRAVLGDMRCDHPECEADHNVLFIHALCHPRAGLAAIYDKEIGALQLFCAECDSGIVGFAVAWGST